MNAYELYNHIFDSANDGAMDDVEYIKEYAGNVFNIVVSNEVAQKMLDCKRQLEIENDNNGEWENNYYYHVRKQLENIEL